MTNANKKSFTPAKLDQVVREMDKECLFETNEKDYLKCCSKPESECKVESRPDFNKTSEHNNYELISSIIVVFIVIIFGIYFVVKKQLYKILLPPYKQELKAIFYGWVIWGASVLAYSILFDEYVKYEIWLSLPPLCAIALYSKALTMEINIEILFRFAPQNPSYSRERERYP